MPRRAKGEGPLKHRSDGRYETRLQVIDKLGRPKTEYFYGKTKAEALKKRTDRKRDLSLGAPADPSKQTLAEYLAEWLDPDTGDLRTHVRPQVIVDYGRAVNTYISPRLGHIPVAKLDSTHVQAMIDDLVDDGFSASTIRKAKAALQSALADARRRGLVGWNACVGARLPTQQKTEMKYWRPDQTKQFLRAVEGQPNEAYYVIALTLGPRIGEILGLRWQDIDLDKGTLRIERQLLQKRVAGAFQFGDVKRYSARRTVNLGKLAVVALRAHRSRMAEKRLPVAEDLVFCTSQGRPFYQSHIQRQFKRLTKMAGQPQIRVHDMRHTAAALMILSRLPDIVISKTLGHSSVTITKDIYGHLFEEQKQQVADAMDRLLGGSV